MANQIIIAGEIQTYSTKLTKMSAALMRSILEKSEISKDQWQQIVTLTNKYKLHHSAYAGQPFENDICLKKMYFKDISRGPSWRCRRRVRYPSYGYPEKTVITAFHIYDHAGDNTGGMVNICSGGVGHRHVELEMVSQVGCGFEFTITIFGEYL